jgi:uncharacterized protein
MNGLPPALQPLLTPGAYPHPVQRVELIETHISWVLLTGPWAYKIKRPVQYPFVDLRSAQHRHFLCDEERRLNARFAAQLYAAVCPITRRDGRVCMGGAGEVIEYAVQMRQFPSDAVLEWLVAAQAVSVTELGQFGRSLARLHASLPVATSALPWGQPQAVQAQMLANLEQCAAAVAQLEDPQLVNALRTPLLQRLAASESDRLDRWRSGRVRECHGDLHCGNIVRYG